jgi:ribosomal protein S18 acetylase RimI-like enzyme
VNDRSPIHIRAALPADYARIIAVGSEVFSPFGNYRETLGHWLRMPGVATHLAERDGMFCGALLLALLLEPPERIVAEVLAIEVAPHAQGTRVGTALMGHVLEQLADGRHHCSVDVIRLSTAEDNVAALRLFLGQGFTATGEDCGRYEGGQRIIRMHRPI